ncbi:MAG: hypothetical protein R2734_19040 [Nocardioides sp.]
MYGSASSEGYRYRLEPHCELGGAATCHRAAVCQEPPGTFRFDVYRSPDVRPPSWSLIGYACLTDAEAGELGGLTPAMVAAAFQRLTWPEPELRVQPPDGETLVNFDTNFFTTLTEPSTQDVTLLGITVTIEATPQSYVWHFGDGAEETTSGPGSPYPTLDITHAYADADVEVSPSVDVVYAGRYRLGTGAWTHIPATLTVPGPAITLSVLEASPQLVG